MSDLQAHASGTGPEESFASVALRLSNLPTPTGALPDGLQEETGQRHVSLASFGGTSQRLSGVVSVQWSNTRVQESASIYLTATAFVSGHSVVSPVPEPATWMLLLAGLAVTSGVTRRREQA